jgi:hypothetical protein
MANLAAPPLKKKTAGCAVNNLDHISAEKKYLQAIWKFSGNLV